MQPPKLSKTLLVAATALLGGIGFVRPGSAKPIPDAPFAATTIGISRASGSKNPPGGGGVASATSTALGALQNVVGHLSDPQALEDAFHSYFAFKTAHPDEVQKPYLYFVDYGQPSTERRGWMFDMSLLKVVEGPFTVAHGRGSAPANATLPTRFSNAVGSAATSLGLYVARELYAFHGTSGGLTYSSTGLRLDGVSTGFNDNALARRVVAHGAPYVTPTKAGRSEGCPAMEPARATRLLPDLANGGMVFLFAPNLNWTAHDPWINDN